MGRVYIRCVALFYVYVGVCPVCVRPFSVSLSLSLCVCVCVRGERACLFEEVRGRHAEGLAQTQNAQQQVLQGQSLDAGRIERRHDAVVKRARVQTHADARRHPPTSARLHTVPPHLWLAATHGPLPLPSPQ
jgi:hypothetical protein